MTELQLRYRVVLLAIKRQRKREAYCKARRQTPKWQRELEIATEWRVFYEGIRDGFISAYRAMQTPKPKSQPTLISNSDFENLGFIHKVLGIQN